MLEDKKEKKDYLFSIAVIAIVGIVAIVAIFLGVLSMKNNIVTTTKTATYDSASLETSSEIDLVGEAFTTCKDTDGGKNIQVKGTTTGPDAITGRPVRKTDFCVTQGPKQGRLDEFFCENGKVYDATYGPEDGCSKCKNGICIGGDSWKVSTSTNMLEISEDLSSGINRETLRDIKQVIGQFELGALANGIVLDKRGRQNPYTQSLYLLGLGSETAKNTGYVVYTEDDNDITADFLFFRSGKEIGKYMLEFPKPLTSTVKNNSLVGIEFSNITMFDKIYTIVEARRFIQSGIVLTLMSDVVIGTLTKGQSRVYNSGGVDYEVTLNYVDNDEAQFIVNGEHTIKLKEGDMDKQADGSTIGLISIKSVKGVYVATFYLGQEKMELRDNNIADKSSSYDLKVNDNTIDDANVIIEGSNQNVLSSIKKISVDMFADDNYFVPANGKLSTAIIGEHGEPEVLFTQNWDIEYSSLSIVPAQDIKIRTSSTFDMSQYNLEFVDGNQYTVIVPIAKTLGGNSLLFGDIGKDFINVENRIITKDDYLVVTDSSMKRGERRTFTLQYKGADKITSDNPVLKFKDLGSENTIEQTYTNTSPLATLKIGGADYNVYKAPQADVQTNDFDIQVDLDGDKILESTGEFVAVTSSYGGEIHLRNDTANKINFTIKTPDNDRDGNAKDSVNTLQATDITGFIYVDNDIVNIEYTGNVLLRTPNGMSNVAYGYTSYGSFITYNTVLNEPSTLTISYPQVQREALVYITANS